MKIFEKIPYRQNGVTAKICVGYKKKKRGREGLTSSRTGR